MAKEHRYFDLELDSLRAIGAWAADCAERVLPLYEASFPGDPRPREAIEGIRAFAQGGKREARLRKLAMAAYSAARAATDPAAAAAAHAASAAAASAYTHPLAEVTQTKHILGAAAYAALARELDHHGDAGSGVAELRWAIEHAPPEASLVLRHMPAREPGKGRLNHLLHELDLALRGPTDPWHNLGC